VELWLGIITYEEWNVVASFSALCFDCGGWMWRGLLFIVEKKKERKKEKKQKTHHCLSMASFSLWILPSR